MITELKDFKAYNKAMEVGEILWKIVQKWERFSIETVGIQLVKSTDSIAANLAEGFGRYHFKEAKNFGYYSRGSLFETKTWITKAHQRGLIDNSTFIKLTDDLELVGRMINNYINSIGAVQEPGSNYGIEDEGSRD